MKSLIITVAGMSSRFNRDTKEDVLKCLYFEGDPKDSLLSAQILKTYDLVDEIIVVGGYKYEDLLSFLHRNIKDDTHKIKTVYNEHYFDYGSGFSLLKGIEQVSGQADEIIFIEGDLFFDSETIQRLILSDKDAISINLDPILSDKAVVLYFDASYHPHYIYDTNHTCLVIREPFSAIYNSGQMWKFLEPGRVRDICQRLSPEQIRGTNLEIIQGYFGPLCHSDLNIIKAATWYNCNTVTDYREAIKSFNP